MVSQKSDTLYLRLVSVLDVLHRPVIRSINSLTFLQWNAQETGIYKIRSQITQTHHLVSFLATFKGGWLFFSRRCVSFLATFKGGWLVVSRRC